MIKEINKTYPLEAEEQEELVKILRRCGIVHFAVPNGGYRRTVEAARLKRQGVVSGIPDLVLPGQDSRWRCLAIEMKRQKGGEVSEEQQEQHVRLKACGWRILVCYGCADAVRQLRELGIL